MEYNPDKFWKENDIRSIIEDLYNRGIEERKWKKDNNWKPDFTISAAQAESMSYRELELLSELYRLIGGAEAVKIIQNKKPEKN